MPSVAAVALLGLANRPQGRRRDPSSSSAAADDAIPPPGLEHSLEELLEEQLRWAVVAAEVEDKPLADAPQLEQIQKRDSACEVEIISV